MKRKPQTHGGARKGAGRPVAGTAAFLIRMKPDTMQEIKKAAGKRTPGQYLDQHFPCSAEPTTNKTKTI